VLAGCVSVAEQSPIYHLSRSDTLSGFDTGYGSHVTMTLVQVK